MNTEISRLASVWTLLANDTKLSRYVSEQDLSYFKSRVEAEGLSFLTITLPALGKTVYSAYQSGVLSPCEGFKCVKDCPYPYFLRKAFEALFDKAGNLLWYHTNPDGVHNPVGSIDTSAEEDYSSAAACIAQLTLMFYKLKVPYSDKQTKQSIASFIETEEFLSTYSLEQMEESIPGMCPLLDIARGLVCRLLHRFDPMDIQPAHGSGASSCKTSPWERYGPPRYVPKLDAVFDYGTWFFSGGNSLVDNLDKLQTLEEHQELSARVCFVPKDSRGPRLISTEPREYMYIQQGLMALLYKAIESYPVVRSMVSCIDQTRNRELACEGSLTGAYSTIDLKDASDRVSLQLVERLFPLNWVRALKACRSDRTTLPDGRQVVMKKFAPMGSACCFPVEALVFWAITMASVATTDKIEPGLLGDMLFGPVRPPVDWLSVLRKEDARLLDETLRAHACMPDCPKVCVFGDDIIVPTRCVQRVAIWLKACGLSVNMHKSFTQGPFRESCGGDYFLGRNIAPIRWNFIPESQGNTDTINYAKFRACDSMNNLIARYGTWELSLPLSKLFEVWYHPIPIVRFTAYGSDADRAIGLALIGDVDILPNRVRKRRHPRYQSRQMLLHVEVAVDREINNDDWSHILRSLLDKGGLRGTSIVSLAKRVKYRQQWVAV